MLLIRRRKQEIQGEQRGLHPSAMAGRLVIPDGGCEELCDPVKKQKKARATRKVGRVIRTKEENELGRANRHQYPYTRSRQAEESAEREDTVLRLVFNITRRPWGFKRFKPAGGPRRMYHYFDADTFDVITAF